MHHDKILTGIKSSLDRKSFNTLVSFQINNAASIIDVCSQFTDLVFLQARRRAIQVDTGTYLNEPSGDQELYAEWLKSFDIEAHKGDISELLVSLVEVRSLYTSLVRQYIHISV